MFWFANDRGHTRLGIIASKRMGNACERNLAKRRIREVFRHVKQDIQQPFMDIVVIAGKGVLNTPFSSLENKLGTTLLHHKVS